jgi:hypothetical protein
VTSAVEPASASRSRSLLEPFTAEEIRRLLWLRAVRLAERHLVGDEHEPCSDHHACRRLAFGLWLYATGRLSEPHGTPAEMVDVEPTERSATC